MDVGTDDKNDKKKWVAELIYFYTGGRIRDGLKLLRGRLKFQTFRGISRAMIDGLGNESLDLAAGGQYGSKDKNSIDSLRTYFKAKKKSPYRPRSIYPACGFGTLSKRTKNR